MPATRRLFLFTFVLVCAAITSPAVAEPDYAVAPRTGLSETHGFSEGLAGVRGTGGYGFLDLQGEYVVEPQYDKAGDFHDGLAPVGDFNRSEVGMRWGYVDRHGKRVVDLQYAEAREFSEGLAAVKTPDGDWQFIDTDGQPVLKVDPRWHGVDADNPNLHHPLGDFHDGWLRIVDERGGSNFVDRDGHKLRDAPYPAAGPFSDGLAVVSTQATPVSEPKGDNELSRLYDSLPGPTPKTYQWAVIDTEGDIRFALPDDMERVGPFIAGRAKFYRDGRWGIIDDSGEVVVPARYEHKPRGYGDRVTMFAVDGERSDNSDGYIEVLDRDGERIARIPFLDDEGRFMIDAKQVFHEGLLGVELARGLNEGKDFERLGWGFMDTHGRMVLEPQFYSVGSFSEGHAFASPMNSGTTGILRNPLGAQNAEDAS